MLLQQEKKSAEIITSLCKRLGGLSDSINIQNKFNQKNYLDYNNENSAWHYIPSSTTLFLDWLNTIENKETKKFLDIGCGVGDKVMLADIFGNFKVSTGIEFNKEYCNVSPIGKWSIINEDLFKFQNYKYYDILYTYMPIKNADIMCKALKHIISKMKIGAELYFLPAGGSENLKNLLEKFTKDSIGYKFTK